MFNIFKSKKDEEKQNKIISRLVKIKANDVEEKVVEEKVVEEKVVEEKGDGLDELNVLLDEIIAEAEISRTEEVVVNELFLNEADRLLEESKIINKLDDGIRFKIDKRKRLNALGFRSASIGITELEMIESQALYKEYEDKEAVGSAINYFSKLYPDYKLLTKESITNICNKYNLSMSEPHKYHGEISDETLDKIENFKLSKIDSEAYHLSSGWGGSLKYYNTEQNEGRAKGETTYKLGLRLILPKTNDSINQSKMIVKPVVYCQKLYYFIVAYWSDPNNESESIINNKNENK